ncbi:MULTISPECIES: Fic family protein [unclassified Synechococcus]|uniref:Fic family protein n=1 Tax=unclassified Synechococcus TaxID=2626047 RepID=UPI0021A8C127|nr:MULTISPECIES: Fic family protein [unclassified Synechococcus]MCT0212051.1 Fic family protein [Synechococcus sp. CS-1326]MCT0232951.1 Fic family protein [Synechococcus sp. CS-1327]
MRRESTGRYEISTTTGESVRAFVPAPLPPHPPITLEGPLQALQERALLACGRLDGVSALLPDPELFLYAYVRREALLSSQIEGTQSSLSDLLLFELEEAPGVPFDDVVEVSSYVAGLEHGLARLREGFPLSSRLLREIHAKLLARGRGADRLPGDFRRSQNWIGGTRPGNASFVPPPPGLVEDCMAQLERFIHGTAQNEHELPVLVRAALAHVQFETIHPFLDGNGRLGRLLIVLVLIDAGVLQQPLLYLSLFFKQHRSRYYELLEEVRRQGDWEAWIDFFLEGIVTTASSAVATAHRLLALFSSDEARLTGLGRSGPSVRRIFQALRQRPLTSIGQIRAMSGLSFPTISKAIETLVELGIAREITGGRRNRLFAYDAYLAILSEGTEPL